MSGQRGLTWTYGLAPTKGNSASNTHAFWLRSRERLRLIIPNHLNSVTVWDQAPSNRVITVMVEKLYE